jgi:hypothetical protein
LKSLSIARSPPPPGTWPGALLIALVLEDLADDQLILPVIVGSFLVYAYIGPWLPPPDSPRYGLDRLRPCT